MKKNLFVAFALLMMGVSMMAQSLPIKGKVTDQEGVPIPGVSILINGTSTGTITDIDGLFNFNVSSSDDVLVFSFIGMKTQEITVGSTTEFNVVLENDVVGLEEVVAIGYGTATKKDLTGSVTSVRIENSPIASLPNVNAMQALQGTTSGVNIAQATGAGASPAIVIRGQNSIAANNQPLIVLDGVIFSGSMNEINTNDIATIDVLKDASATAIYGSRSSNGVIMITTKKGKSDKPTISFNTYLGVQDWTRRPDMRNGEQFFQWRKDNAAIRGMEDLAPENILWPLEYKAYSEGHEMDWMEEITQFAPIQNYQASVSGKTEKTNYYVSGSYLDQQGVVENDSYENLSFVAKLENNITSWMKFGVNIYYSQMDYSGNSPALYDATYMTPYSYKYVEGYDNQMQRYPTGSTSLPNPYFGNPGVGRLGTIDDDMDKSYSIRGNGYFNVDVPFVKGLSCRLNFNKRRVESEKGMFHYEHAEVNTLIPEEIEDPTRFLNKAYGARTSDASSGWLIDNLLTYKKKVGDHSIDLLLGYTREYDSYTSTSYAASDFAEAGTTVLGWNGLYLGSNVIKDGSLNFYPDYDMRNKYPSFYESSNVGYIGRANYNYKSKYHATLNFRRDGFSGFSEGRKFGTFPGGSIAWTISEEPFIKDNTQVLDYLKLRMSYGKNGNQGISPYETYARIGTGNTVFGDQSLTYSYPSTLSNLTLSWETTTALNFGVNFALFGGRIAGNLDMYKSETTDQLLTRKLPIMTGYDQIRTNIAKVENKGFEFTLNTQNIKSASGFSWDTGIVFWLNRNKLVSLYGDIDGDGVEDDDLGNDLFVGKPLGAIYDFTADGVVQTEDTEYINTYGFQPGDMKFKDISGPDGVPDGEITADDRSIIGYAQPKFNMNISNTLTYKNIQLYFDFNIIAGGGKNNYYMANNAPGLNPGQIMSETANWLNEEYWMPDNQSTKYPRPNYGNPYEYGFYQSRAFLRLQNLSLSYVFTKNITDRIGVDNLKVFATGKNLFTVTDWVGLDPETAGTIGSSNPSLRIITLGVNLSF
ncbi:MAG: TonB-dependent receptor [Marinilabiliaceae bacterium]|nr:TonB-dependent receptor [Marinilabiliaceae bacterium]